MFSYTTHFNKRRHWAHLLRFLLRRKYSSYGRCLLCWNVSTCRDAVYFNWKLRNGLPECNWIFTERPVPTESRAVETKLTSQSVLIGGINNRIWFCESPCLPVHLGTQTKYSSTSKFNHYRMIHSKRPTAWNRTQNVPVIRLPLRFLTAFCYSTCELSFGRLGARSGVYRDLHSTVRRSQREKEKEEEQQYACLNFVFLIWIQKIICHDIFASLTSLSTVLKGSLSLWFCKYIFCDHFVQTSHKMNE